MLRKWTSDHEAALHRWMQDLPQSTDPGLYKSLRSKFLRTKTTPAEIDHDRLVKLARLAGLAEDQQHAFADRCPVHYNEAQVRDLIRQEASNA